MKSSGMIQRGIAFELGPAGRTESYEWVANGAFLSRIKNMCQEHRRWRNCGLVKVWEPTVVLYVARALNRIRGKAGMV